MFPNVFNVKHPKPSPKIVLGDISKNAFVDFNNENFLSK